MKILRPLSLSTIAILSLFSACNVPPTEPEDLLEVNYFTPANPASGDTVILVGRSLELISSISVDGVAATNFLTEDGINLSFLLENDLENSIVVKDVDGNTFSLFPTLNIRVHDIQRILLTDFNENGIRRASPTTTLERSAWQATVLENAAILSSPERNGFFHLSTSKNLLTINDESSFAGDFSNFNEIEHDRSTAFSRNFFEYGGNVIPFPSTQQDLDHYYISFRVNFNGNLNSQLNILMDNDVAVDGLKPYFQLEFESLRTEGAANVQNTDLYDSDWHQVVIPFSSFSTNFGFDPTIRLDSPEVLFSLQNFNRIKFVLSDNFDNNRTGRESANYERVEVNLDDIQILSTEEDLSTSFQNEYNKTKVFQQNGPAWYD